MTRTDAFSRVEVTSALMLRDWLEAHHDQEASVWLVTWKKTAPEKYVSTAEVLDELVAFGWIDGIRRKLDDSRTMQLISPRKTQYWAKSYKDRAEKLIREGRMAAPGQRSIDEARKSGLWSFMDDVDALIVPCDLRRALDDHASSASYFNAAPPAYRRNLLRWVKLAKTKATRTKRIETIVAASARAERIPQM